MSVHGAGVIQLSESTVSRLIQSTGNLYWTHSEYGVGGENSVYRASKSSTPGEEIALYGEPYQGGVPGSKNFGAIVWAKIGEEYYGYFVANDKQQGTSEIKRISLAGGGSADVLATSPAEIGDRDLATNGAYLCWADAQGIRSMPIEGGPVTTLASGEFVHLAMHGSTVYYPSEEHILSVADTGGPVDAVVQADATVTALYVGSAPERAVAERARRRLAPPIISDRPMVSWGQVDGAVKSVVIGQAASTVYQQASEATVATVSWAGSRLLWTNAYGRGSAVQMWTGGSTTTVYGDPSIDRFAPVDVQGDSAAAYVADEVVFRRIF